MQPIKKSVFPFFSLISTKIANFFKTSTGVARLTCYLSVFAETGNGVKFE